MADPRQAPLIIFGLAATTRMEMAEPPGASRSRPARPSARGRWSHWRVCPRTCSNEWVLDRARRTIVAVVADFDSRSSEAIALARFGVRVVAVGLAGAEARGRLKSHGILLTGLCDEADDVPWQAMDSIGGVDAVLLTRGDWQDVKDAVWSKEIESAALSGRSTIPILDQNEAGVRDLRSARRWAAYTIALAWGAAEDKAKEIARKTRGYSIEDLTIV